MTWLIVSDSLVLVHLCPLESPMRRVILHEVTNVGIDLRKDEWNVEAHANLSSTNGLHGSGSTLIHISKEKMELT